LAAFPGTYLSAGIILLASLLVGRAVMLALGRREASFLEGAVGLALLILVCTIAIRLPGHGGTSVALLVLLVLASLLFLFVRREAILGPAVGVALPVALVAGLLSSLPFIASWHIGVPGVGLNNDMAMHLVDTDYLLDPTGPEPQSIVNGYPIGPHSLVATVVHLLGTEPVQGWLGLLVAAPVLTAITSLGVLRRLPGWRHILGAALVGTAYLTASVLGIAGFKELIAGMFLIAFALGLREIERSPDGRVAVLIGLALITAAMIPVYSLPGVGWLVITAGVWIIAQLARIRRESGPAGVRRVVRTAMPYVIPAAIVLLLVGLTQLPKVIDFLESGSIGNVADTNSKLRYVVSPLETFGIWPSGNWLLGTHDFTHDWVYWLFGLIGIAGAVVGFAWWMRRRDYAIPAAVISGIVVYLVTKYFEDGGLYILAKAVVVPASVVMLLVVTALLVPGGGLPKRIFAAVFIALAAYSSFLALRDSIIAPDHRLHELAAFQERVRGENVLALTSDRFTDYGLRTATVYSPAFNSEIRVPSAQTKSQRLPIDFDSVPSVCPPSSVPQCLNQFPYAVTTSAIYQSQAPPGWRLADSTDSYRLWRRTGTTPQITNLFEEARPGRVFRCNRPKLARFRGLGGEALTWQPRSVIAKRLYWKAAHENGVVLQGSPIDSNLSPGETASQRIALPRGRWELSIQYVSPVTGIEVRAPGLAVHLPAGMDAAIPYRPDQGPYWPVGEITSRGGPVRVSVTADDVNWFQSLVGVDAQAVIGNLTAVNPNGFVLVPTASACRLFVDHIIGTQRPRGTEPAGEQGQAKQGKQRSSGKPASSGK
jgi:hypothetical protein